MKLNMIWQDIVPVILSIVVIVLIAVIEKQSKFVAAISTTMPVTAALGVWIVYSSSSGDTTSVAEFTHGMLIALIPTIAFLVTVLLASRAQLKLVPILLLGYSIWAAGLALIFGTRKLAGI